MSDTFSGRAEVMIGVSVGELIDKITILEIKSERIQDTSKRANVLAELRMLTEARRQSVPPSQELDALTARIRSVNAGLWDIEDDIRRCEADGDFGPRFVQLARSVYRENDKRSRLKRAISELADSAYVEEKDYASYS